MKAEYIEKCLSALSGSEGSSPFGPDVLVFKVMGKIFALVSQSEEIPRVTLKCLPEDGLALVGMFKSISPCYHMNKKHWISVYLDGEIPEEIINDLAHRSYMLIINKLSMQDKTRLLVNQQHKTPRNNKSLIVDHTF